MARLAVLTTEKLKRNERLPAAHAGARRSELVCIGDGSSGEAQRFVGGLEPVLPA